MSEAIFPGLILILGGLLLPLVPKGVRKWIAWHCRSSVDCTCLPEGWALTTQIFEYTLVPVGMDS